MRKARFGYVGLALLLWCMTPFAHAADEVANAKRKVYATSRTLLATARAHGAVTFSVVIASASGRNSEVAKKILDAGGKIDRRDDEVDYLRATLPIERVMELAHSKDIEAIDADASLMDLGPPLPGDSSAGTSSLPLGSEGEAPLLSQPYVPGRELQTSALRSLNPTYDGRGVTVAVLDRVPDFLLPELQFAKAADGVRIAKFADIRTSVPPFSQDKESPWLTTQGIKTSGGAFVVDGATYRSPYDGTFHFAKGNSDYIRSHWKQFIDPGVEFSLEKVLFGVLWDERSERVWVDTDCDGDFNDEHGLRPFAQRGDYGTFAAKVTDPRARPSLPFVVQLDAASQRVAILFGADIHGTGAAGSVAASRDGAGRIEGVAPGARLYWVAPGYRNSSLIESVVDVFRNPQVDLVVLESTSAAAYAPHDGRTVISTVYDRATRFFHKLIVQPAGNSYGMTQATDTCARASILCIGAYEHRDAFATNHGLTVPQADNLHFLSSFGPAGDGSLRPTVLAPSGWLSTTPALYEPSWHSFEGVYSFPPGYQVWGGTSQAGPTAGGAVAVLIGAARAEKLNYVPERLMMAITSSARYLSNLPAYTQGNGLLQIDSALQWLRRWNDHELQLPLKFDAPVRTATSGSLPVAHRGVGLFEREGWVAGKIDERVVWVTYDGPMSMTGPARVELLGNDGTFGVANSLELPLGRRTPLRLTVAPKTAGAHSAVLRLLSTDGVVLGSTLMTVVAGEPLNDGNGYTIIREVAVARPGFTSVFVTVPHNAKALIVRITSQHHSPGFGFRYSPWMPDSRDGQVFSNISQSSFFIRPGTREDVFPDPQAGTWELLFSNLEDMAASYGSGRQLRAVLPTKIMVSVSVVVER